MTLPLRGLLPSSPLNLKGIFMSGHSFPAFYGLDVYSNDAGEIVLAQDSPVEGRQVHIIIPVSLLPQVVKAMREQARG